jgi:hypothetical protein
MLLLGGLGAGAQAAPARSRARLAVWSASFRAESRLPSWTAFLGCAPKAQNRSPDLRWTRGPAGTRSYAVILFDPDAPTGHGFYHWVLLDAPPSTIHLAAGAGDPRSAFAPLGAHPARNDFGTRRYGGPCPPPGDHPHRYVFTVDALDVPRLLHLGKDADGPTVRSALRGHVLAEGTLTGRFSR